MLALSTHWKKLSLKLDLSDILVRRLTWGHSKPTANLSLEQELVVRKNVQFGSLMLGESRSGCIIDAAFQVLDSEHGRDALKDVNSQDVRKLKDVNSHDNEFRSETSHVSVSVIY